MYTQQDERVFPPWNPYQCMTVDTRLAPSTLLVNGKIITVDQNNTIQEAVALKDDKILALGSTTDILNLKSEETKVIDLNGKTVLPGFIDTHSHPGVAATVFLQINCITPPTKSITEILDKIREAVANAKHGEWIRGINYNARARMVNPRDFYMGTQVD
jgi:hypothetical protein